MKQCWTLDKTKASLSFGYFVLGGYLVKYNYFVMFVVLTLAPAAIEHRRALAFVLVRRIADALATV